MFEDIRKEFPILKDKLLSKGLVYLDSAATTQKPQEVIDRINQYYEQENLILRYCFLQKISLYMNLNL